MMKIPDETASDSFTGLMAIIKLLADPAAVEKTVAELRAVSAEHKQCAAQASRLIEEAAKSREGLDDRESQVGDREQRVAMQESDALVSVERAKKAEAEANDLHSMFEKDIDEKTRVLSDRERALATREEKLQSETARRLEEFAARENAIAEQEAAADEAAARVKSLEQELIEKRAILVKQIEALGLSKTTQGEPHVS